MPSHPAPSVFSRLGNPILDYLKYFAYRQLIWQPHLRLLRPLNGIIALLCLATALNAFAASVEIAARFDPRDGKETIKLSFLVGGQEVLAKLQPNDPLALKAENYTIIERKSGEPDREVPLDGNPRAKGLFGIESILLIPKEEIPAKGKNYIVRVAHTLVIEAPDGTHTAVPPKDYPLDNSIAEIDREILAPESVESKLELQAGTGGGVVSVKYHLRKDQIKRQLRDGVTSNDTWLHVDLTAKADVNITPSEKDKYFDSMVAELDLFHAYSWPRLTDKMEALPAIMGHSEFGLTGRFETDRDFKTMDATVGAVYSVFVKNPVTTWLHSAFVPKLKEAGVAPLFIVGYDYVSEIRNGTATDKGSNRVRAEFSWSLPILREQALPILGSTDADAVFDVGGIFDVDKQRLTDTTKITLEVRQHEVTDKSWSYILTYAQGKATPTYNHFDAILAGLKKSF
jgi:hypothetical protein